MPMNALLMRHGSATNINKSTSSVDSADIPSNIGSSLKQRQRETHNKQVAQDNLRLIKRLINTESSIKVHETYQRDCELSKLKANISRYDSEGKPKLSVAMKQLRK